VRTEHEHNPHGHRQSLSIRFNSLLPFSMHHVTEQTMTLRNIP